MSGRRAMVERVPAPVWQGAIVLLAIALTAYYTLRTNRDFWYDEAMLVEAIRADGWLLPWQAMSHFEQASPYGLYLLQKVLIQTFGLATNVLRLPSLAAYAVGGLAIWRAGSLVYGGLAATLAAVVGLTGATIVGSSGDFKQYVFEYAVSGVLLWLGARAVVRHAAPSATVPLFAVATLSVLISNTVPFVLPGVALAVWLWVRPSRARARWLAIGTAGFLVIFLAWYLISIRPSTVFQIAYPTYRETSTQELYESIVQSVGQPNATFAFSVVGLAAAGSVAALIWVRRLAPAFIPAAVAVVLGWVGVRSGIVPFSAERHVLFLVPVIAFAMGAGVQSIARVIAVRFPPERRGASAVISIVVVVVCFATTATIQPNATVLRQQAGQALATYASQCSGFWVDWWTQPATTLYASQLGILGRVHGVVSTTSGLGQQAWAYRVIDDPKPYQTRTVAYIRAHPSTCIMTGGRDDENPLVFAPLQAVGLECQQFGVVAGIQMSRCQKEVQK